VQIKELSTTMAKLSFGLTLASRGVLLGVTTANGIVSLAEEADQAGVFESIVVGDSMTAVPRLECVTLMSAIASRTSHCKLGVNCMASFPIRDPVLLALQWATFDQISEGRTLLVACSGALGRTSAGEDRLYRITAEERYGRLEEGIQILRLLWGKDDVTFQGKHYQLDGVSIGIRPHKGIPPIYIATNATNNGKALTRIANFADGWISGAPPGDSPTVFKSQWEQLLQQTQAAGRQPGIMRNMISYAINIQDDPVRAHTESKDFLERYYNEHWSDEHLEQALIGGPPRVCAEKIRRWVGSGAQGITFRLTSWDQPGQLHRLINDVLGSV
jgi:alkanesulfonate monooxygenase SsuD/methylene tetrahydromethanopterin reductase-like flavin-dependent oxidoreductase (luciferase family)